MSAGRSPGRVRLRAARPGDLALLRHWDAQPHVRAADPNDDWAWETELERDPPWREQLIAEEDERPVGFVQIIDPAEEATHYWGQVGPGLRALDIWIGDADDLGRGLGTLMMQQALARCFQDPRIEAALVEPLVGNQAAQRFYRRLGFVRVERRWFGADHCDVYRLERAEWWRRQPGGGPG